MAHDTEARRRRDTDSFSHQTPSNSSHRGCTWNSTTAMPAGTWCKAVKNSHQLANMPEPSSSTQGKVRQPTHRLRHAPRQSTHSVSPSNPKAHRNQVVVMGAACASCTNTPMLPSSALPSRNHKVPDTTEGNPREPE